MSYHVFDDLGGHASRRGEPANGSGDAMAKFGFGVGLLDGLSQIEDRIGALEGRITLQRLWRDRLHETGRDASLSDELLATYERLLANYHEYRTLAIDEAWSAPDIRVANLAGECRPSRLRWART